jgi:hypothetical protein
MIGVLVGAAVVATGACNRGGVDLDKVTPGTEVTLTRQDGGVVKGPVQSVEPSSVVVRVGERPKTVPRAEITDVQVDEPGQPPAELPAAAKFREFVVAAGTPIEVKLTSSAASNTSHAEDAMTAELTDTVMVDGMAVIPSGSSLSGTVLRAEPSAKVKGLASLAVRFDSIRAGGETYPVSMTYSHTADSTKGSDAKKIGIPAAAGAVLGGILGGKKGAVTGGAIGGGAGAAVVLSTSGKEVVLPAGTILKLTLDRDLEVKVAIK